MHLGLLTQLDPAIKKFEEELNARLVRLELIKSEHYDDSWIRNQFFQIRESIKRLEEAVLKLQIVYPNGETVKFPAGTEIESDLIQLIVDNITTKPITIRTRSGLQKRIQDALYKFKAQITKVPVKLSQP